MKELVAVGMAGVLLCGCRSGVGVHAEEMQGDSEALAAYLDLCQMLAVGDEPGAARQEDWMVGAGATSWERSGSYRIVYADAKYLSFRAEEYSYRGGAHGGTKITVGTFDRRTGRRLSAEDLIPKECRQEVVRELRRKVIEKIGGEDQLQGEVTLTDNCFVAHDGIHFVYNEYEVACYAAGAVEVVTSLSMPCGLECRQGKSDE